MKKFSINKDAIIIPLLLTSVIWLIFFVESIFHLKDCYGIIPLQLKGLRGILLAPLFHGSFQHIISNTIPLFILTLFTFQFYKKLAYFVLIFGWLSSGLIVWLLPDFSFFGSHSYSCHIGASGLIYVLAFFLFFSGILRWEKSLMAISLIIVFLYGSIIWGMFPQELFGIYNSNISWQSHLSGGLTGFILAYLLRNIGRKKETSSWQKKDYDSTYDNELWEQYTEEFMNNDEKKN